MFVGGNGWFIKENAEIFSSLVNKGKWEKSMPVFNKRTNRPYKY